MKESSPSALYTILAFFAIYFIWGTTYLAIEYALRDFPPFLLSGFRFITASALLYVYSRLHNESLKAIRNIQYISISGILMLVGGSGMVTCAEVYVNSATAAILVATEPFFFILLDKPGRQLYFSNKRVIIGLILGFTGMVWFCVAGLQPAGDTSTVSSAIGYLILMVSNVFWVTGALLLKKKDPGVSVTLTTSIQLIAAGMISLLIGYVLGEGEQFSVDQISKSSWAALLYLIVMGSIVAFLAYNYLLKIKPPAIVSTHTYINPVVAVFMG